MADRPISPSPRRARRNKAPERQGTADEPLWSGYPDLVVELDAEGRIVRAAGPWPDRSKQAGTGFLGLLPMEQRGPLRSAMGKVAASGTPESVELYDADRDTWWWYRILPGPEDPALVLIRTDISHSRRGETQLRHRLERLEAMLAHARDGMALVDLQGNLVLVNDALCDTVGFTREDLIGRSVYQLTHPDDLVETAAQVRRLLMGKVARIEAVKRCLHRDGHVVRCRQTTALVRSSEGSARYFAIQLANVAAEAEGVATRKRHRDRHQDEERFAAFQRLAREVTQTLQDRGEERWNDLVAKLMMLAGTGGATKEVDLGSLIASHTDELRKALGAGRSLRVALQARPTAVRADPEMLRAIMLQLMVNAREATPHGGEVIVETSTISLEEGHCQENPGSRVGPHVQLSVSDTGSGMDRDTRLHASEPFFTTKDPVSHRGLGLALVRAVVKRAGGHLCLYSEVGRGTSVKMFFPTVGGSRTGPLSVEATGKTVLVAEDDPAQRGTAATMLRRLGYQVVTAEDGLEALQLIKSGAQHFDLVLLDVVMPRMGGLEAYDRIRSLDRQLPICLMTGYSAEMALETLTHATALMIAKPFGLAELSAVVAQALAPPAGRGN